MAEYNGETMSEARAARKHAQQAYGETLHLLYELGHQIDGKSGLSQAEKRDMLIAARSTAEDVRAKLDTLVEHLNTAQQAVTVE